MALESQSCGGYVVTLVPYRVSRGHAVGVIAVRRDVSGGNSLFADHIARDDGLSGVQGDYFTTTLLTLDFDHDTDDVPAARMMRGYLVAYE